MPSPHPTCPALCPPGLGQSSFPGPTSRPPGLRGASRTPPRPPTLKKEAADAWRKHPSQDLLQHNFPKYKRRGQEGSRTCGRAGGGFRAAQSRETGAVQWGDLPPLLRWTFQQIIGGGRSILGPPQDQGMEVGGGQEGRELKGTWRGLRPTPPGLGQGVEMTREGPPAHKGDLLVAAAPFGVTSASTARAPPPAPRETCLQSAGPRVARTTVSWTALHLVSPQKPNTTDKQEAIYIINNNNN